MATISYHIREPITDEYIADIIKENHLGRCAITRMPLMDGVVITEKRLFGTKNIIITTEYVDSGSKDAKKKGE